MRYKLKQDENSHWYLILADSEKLFVRLLEDMENFYTNEEWGAAQESEETFEECFGDCRIDGPHNLTFTDPLEE